MKKLFLLLLTVFALNSCEQDPEIIGVDAEKKQLKVDVCHYDATTDTWKSISINENALKAHLKHGDTQGDRCGYTYVPDDRFEQSLIYWGYDDVLDDYVLTSNIRTVEELIFMEEEEGNQPPVQPHAMYNMIGIEDFTGLKYLELNHSYSVETLDLSMNNNLEELTLISGNGIKNLTLPKESKLKKLNFLKGGGGGIILENLDLSTSTSLEYANIENTWLKSLDFSKCISLEHLHMYSNGSLQYLNLNNENNHILSIGEWGRNRNLECIQVDDVEWSIINWASARIDPTLYSEDCGF